MLVPTESVGRLLDGGANVNHHPVLLAFVYAVDSTHSGTSGLLVVMAGFLVCIFRDCFMKRHSAISAAENAITALAWVNSLLSIFSE